MWLTCAREQRGDKFFLFCWNKTQPHITLTWYPTLVPKRFFQRHPFLSWSLCRLYSRLDEVKLQEEVRSRQEAYAKNREKAKEFHKVTFKIPQFLKELNMILYLALLYIELIESWSGLRYISQFELIWILFSLFTEATGQAVSAMILNISFICCRVFCVCTYFVLTCVFVQFNQ